MTDFNSYKFDYLAWRQKMLENFKLEQLSLTSGSSDIVTGPTALSSGNTGVVFKITTPAGHYITIPGELHMSHADRAMAAYGLGIRLADTSDTEISDITQIHVYKTSPSGKQTEIGRWVYGQMKLYKQSGTTIVVKGRDEMFRWPQSIELPSNNSLKFEVVSSNKTISSDTTYSQLVMTVDLWTPRPKLVR